MRSWSRAAPAAVLALVLAACLSAPAPQSEAIRAIAEAAAQAAAPGATLVDAEFEAFIAGLDLRKSFGARADEILEQLRKTRAAVTGRVRPPAARVRPPGLAAPAGRPPRVLMEIWFSIFFADVLDPMTAGRGAGGQTKSDPYTETADGPTATTTTSLNVTFQASATGSRVQLVGHWTFRQTATDKTSGSTLLDLTDDRTLVGVIDVCPDASGAVPASLNTHTQIAERRGGSTTTRTTTTSDTFKGQADDAAVLRQVRQDFSDQSSWQTSSGAGSLSATMAVTWPAGESGISSTVDPGGFSGKFNTTGELGSLDVQKTVGLTFALDLNAVGGAYKEAQKLWRNGRCVVLEAPDYKAETPLAVAEQEKVQHDEEVDQGSETKFAVKARHRFGAAALSQPVQAELTSGDKKLAPNRLDALPSGLTYTAPDEPDKQATARLRSTSKRGIGTLVLAFHTVEQKLTINVRGTLRMPVPGTPVSYVFDISIGPAEFRKVDATTYEATGPMSLKGRVLGLPPEIPCELTFTGSGETAFVATVEKRGDARVWVVRPDPRRGAENLGGIACVYEIPTVQYGAGGGGYGPIFMQTAGDVVIPLDGGTVPVRATRTPVAGVTYSVEGTVTATVKKE